MNVNYEKILLCYEDFKLHKGELYGKDGFFDYRAPSSLHSDVTCFAYGISETRGCLSLQDSYCISKIVIDKNDLVRRFYIKVQACLFEWQKYICAIEIVVNGKVAYKNDKEFFENVNLGWPTVYIPLDNRLLNVGTNVIEFSQVAGETELLISCIDLLSLPAIKPCQQLTCRKSVRVGDEFTLSFADAQKQDSSQNANISVVYTENCMVLEIRYSPLNANHVMVKVKALNPDAKLVLKFDKKYVDVVMPQVFNKSDDLCLVGMDSDDHRHDNTDETDRILEIFENTCMGNFWQARPQEFRNYYELSGEEIWKRRIDYLRAFGTKISQSDSANVMPYLSGLCGKDFVGKHFHEAYLYFCAALERDKKMASELFLDTEALKNSETFGESRKRFEHALGKMYQGCKASKGLTSVGSPSLLTIYEAGSGFERVTIEPVSNVNILLGAVRGVAPKMWGAHIPTDWYFGEPNDKIKSRKFLLAMLLLYINGADYIYAENALFKTNAFSRKDWEDEFCVRNRSYLRDFYDYTVRNPREGSLVTDLAVIYGNNEYIMWHYDDRMAELGENDDWDARVWGKWEDNRHHKCWRAIDAWLPLAENQHSRINKLNLDLFSGTPYGSVNVIPYSEDYRKYKAIVLLGWNTYEDGFANKIYDFVSQGGTAFVSYCHFNLTDRCDQPMEYASTDEVIRLLNLSGGKIVSSVGNIHPDHQIAVCGHEPFTILRTRIEDGDATVKDEEGNVLVWTRKIGKGTLFWGTFADYSCPDGKMAVLKYVLKRIGEDIAEVICSNPNICFTERVKDGVKTIDMLNMCSNGKKNEKYKLTFKDGKEICGEISPCQIKKERG